jgi:hypothetical protein
VNTTGNVYLNYPFSSIVVATATAALQVNTPAHIVCTKSGSTTKLYVNGQDVTSAGTDVTFPTNSSAFTLLGTANNDGDEFAVYGTALSAARVKAHYLAGIAPQDPSVVVDPQIFS